MRTDKLELYCSVFLHKRPTCPRQFLLIICTACLILAVYRGRSCFEGQKTPIQTHDIKSPSFNQEIRHEDLIPEDVVVGKFIQNETAVKLLLDFNNKPVHLEKTKEKKPKTPSKNEGVSPQLEEWSKEWPRINLKDCSEIVYMNRGLNSPERIKSRPYPRTGIVSFPGSGNTWIRHLIQQATGLWTGSVYHDRSLQRGGFKAELNDCADNSTVTVKAHYARLDGEQHCKFDRIVLLIRDPFRAVLAEFNWRTTGSHTSVADKRLYETDEWKAHVMGRTERWHSTTTEWIERFSEPGPKLNAAESGFTYPPNASRKLLLVSYERLKRNTVKEMERIVQFLGLPAFRSKCVQDDVDGNFRRASKPSESITCLFKVDHLDNTIIDGIRAVLRVTEKHGLGNIAKDFEGPDGDEISDKCS